MIILCWNCAAWKPQWLPTFLNLRFNLCELKRWILGVTEQFSLDIGRFSCIVWNDLFFLGSTDNMYHAWCCFCRLFSEKYYALFVYPFPLGLYYEAIYAFSQTSFSSTCWKVVKANINFRLCLQFSSTLLLKLGKRKLLF